MLFKKIFYAIALIGICSTYFAKGAVHELQDDSIERPLGPLVPLHMAEDMAAFRKKEYSIFMATAEQISHRQAAVENSLRYPVKIIGKIDLMKLLDRMKINNTPGVNIAVVENGKLAWAKGYGVTSAQTLLPVDENTLFQAASISKMATALGVLLLVQEGKIDLDTDVSIYLKRWKVPKKHPFEAEPLTLRQLLSHTGGVTIHGVEGYAPGEKMPTVFEFLNGVKPISKNAAVEVGSKPGEKYQYSGGGTTIIEILIEDITSMSFKDYIQKALFDPLGMTRSTFIPPHVSGEHNYASGHFEDGKPRPEKYKSHPSLAAASLWTTPTDLAKLGMNIQQSIIGEPTGLLGQRLAKEMVACTVKNNEKFAGFGCSISKDGMVFEHGGSNPGMRCRARFTTNGKQGVVIMTNSDNGTALEMELQLSVSDVYKWPASPSLEKIIARIDPELLKGYCGEFWMVVNKGTEKEKMVKSQVVSLAGDHLSIQTYWYEGEDFTELSPLMDIYPESDTAFFSRYGDSLAFDSPQQFKYHGEINFKR